MADNIELKDGSILCADPVAGEPPRGYELVGKRLLKLIAVPGLCEPREVPSCPTCRYPRWWCLRDGIRLPINPGVCARCQNLVPTLTFDQQGDSDGE